MAYFTLPIASNELTKPDKISLSNELPHDIKVYNVLLNDKIEQVNWYQMKNTGDSIFREKTHHFINCDIIKRETIDLDNFILQNNILQNSKNILITPLDI